MRHCTVCQLTCAGEGGEVVACLAIEETGVSKPPHVLCLDLCTVESTLHQHPHKQREEVCGEGGREGGRMGGRVRGRIGGWRGKRI